MGAFRNDDERLPVVTTDSHTDQGTPGFPWTIRQSEKSERNSRRKLQSEDPSTGHKWLYSLALSFFLPSSQLQRDAAAEPSQKPPQQRIPKQTRKQKQKQMQQEIQKPSEEQTGYWALFRLALPSILLQSGAPLAITVQTALLGRKDTQLVAAWAVVATATNAATVIFNFLVVGVTAKVTKVVAVGGWTQVGARIRLALAMALATGAVAVALLLSAQGLLWTMLSHSPSVLQYAKSYFYLRVMGVPPQLLVMCTSGVLQGYKHVVLVAWLQAARVLLDVLASYISLYVLDWGLVGVGIGTILASCTVAAASFACILLLPPPEGKGKICIFSPILSFLARRVAGPQRLLCRASSQLISRTCSKARMCGVAVLEDARVLLLDGLERDRDGKEGGGIEGRTVKSCESAYELIQQSHGCAHGEGATEYEAREGWDEEKEGREGQQVEGRESEVDGAEESRPVAKKPEKEADEESERNTYNEEMLLGVDGGVRRVGPAWPCVVELEVRVVVEGEEESTNLLSKAGKGERMGKGEEVEKSESPGDEKGESVASEEILRGGGRGGSKRGAREEGKSKAEEEEEEERINEVLNESTWKFLRDGLSTILRSTLVQVSFFLVLSCATSLGVHAVAAHQILMQLWMVNIYIADGFATAGTIVASSLAGKMAQARTREEHAGHLADLRLVCWRVLRMGLIAGVLICAAYTSLEDRITALFTYDAATKAQLKEVWLYLALIQPLNSVVFVYDGLIYAAQAFSYMAACLTVGFFTLFLPVVSLAYFHFKTLLAAWAAKGVLNAVRFVVASYKIHVDFLCPDASHLPPQPFLDPISQAPKKGRRLQDTR